MSPGDTVARLGGDEFGLLLEELAGDAEAAIIAERTVAAMSAPMELAGRDVTTAISVGFTLGSADRGTADELMEEADLALYEAKRTGKGRAVQFTSALARPNASGADADPTDPGP